MTHTGLVNYQCDRQIAKTPFRWAEVATVTLLVGEAKTAFHVHEAELFDASSFFKAAFTSEFRESSDRTMLLPEDDDSVVELFIDWLYRQRYKMTTPAAQGSGDIYMQPVRLFVLADKYDVPNLKNLILSQIFLRIKKDRVGRRCMPKLHTVAYAYEHTAENSPIRKLLAGSLTCRLSFLQRTATQEWLRNHSDVSTQVNVSFAKNMLKRVSPFDGDMPEEYMDKEQVSEK